MDKIKPVVEGIPAVCFPRARLQKEGGAGSQDSGMTLDAISASNMRHVLNGVIGDCREVSPTPDNAKE